MKKIDSQKKENTTPSHMVNYHIKVNTDYTSTPLLLGKSLWPKMWNLGKWVNAGLSMGHICLSHFHPIAIYACPISSQPMGRFPWDSYRNDIPMDKPRLVHGTYISVPFPSHHIAIYVCPIPWDVFHGIPIGMTCPWTSLGKCQLCMLTFKIATIHNLQAATLVFVCRLCRSLKRLTDRHSHLDS